MQLYEVFFQLFAFLGQSLTNLCLSLDVYTAYIWGSWFFSFVGSVQQLVTLIKNEDHTVTVSTNILCFRGEECAQSLAIISVLVTQ